MAAEVVLTRAPRASTTACPASLVPPPDAAVLGTVRVPVGLLAERPRLVAATVSQVALLGPGCATGAVANAVAPAGAAGRVQAAVLHVVAAVHVAVLWRPRAVEEGPVPAPLVPACLKTARPIPFCPVVSRAAVLEVLGLRLAKTPVSVTAAGHVVGPIVAQNVDAKKLVLTWLQTAVARRVIHGEFVVRPEAAAVPPGGRILGPHLTRQPATTALQLPPWLEG